jgi:tetratricopeptide (TPR) repeat protein
MIVKNEEEHLARCLASAKPLVDQMIVVDTGSTDRTVEIAKSFGAIIHHHEWEGNFSKARNISMGYADTDWIFILDADEELNSADVSLLRDTIRTTEFKAIAVSVYNYSAQKRMYTSFLPSVRFFRRDLGAYYEGIVHNQLRFPGQEGVLRVSARIDHYGYGLAPEVMARKAARTKALLEQQLRENPDNGFAHFNLAQLLRGSEDRPSPEMMDRVIFHAGRAVDLSAVDNPKERHVHLMALHQLVTAYFNKGDHKQAASNAHRALALKPDYLDAIISLGHIHSLDGQFDLARKYYLEYLDRQKSYDEHTEVDHIILLHLRSRHNALYGLGLVSEMQNDPQEAITWYERCIAERDDYLDAHYRLGTAFLQLGEKEKARRALARELELHGTNTDACLALVDLLCDLEEPGEAQATLRDCLERDPQNARLLLRVAQQEFRQRNMSAAQQYLDMIRPDDPLHSQAEKLRADVLYEQGHYVEAIALYEEYLRAYPDDWDIINNVGNCRFRSGDYVGAETLYRRIIDAGRADKHVYRNLGVTLAHMDRIDDAVFALESYAQMEPEDVESAGFLGDLHYGRRDYVRAIDEYEKVLESQPRRPDTLTRLGDCYLNRGAIAAALIGYERALAADPEYRPAWDRLHDIRNYLVARIKGGGETQSSAGQAHPAEAGPASNDEVGGLS